MQREGLVASFGDQSKSLNEILKASERNLRLAQVLRTEKKPGRQLWEVIAQTIAFFNEELHQEERKALANLIIEKANKHRIDPLLMTALISQESAFYERARSPVGAYGYGQIMPETAKFLGINSNIPAQNLEGCAKYLSQQFTTWARAENRIALVLASYNAGPGAVARYGGVPPYRETENYVQIITARYDTLKNAQNTSSDRNERLAF